MRHCHTDPAWSRCAAELLRSSSVSATASLSTDPIMLAALFSSVCKFQTILMKHWVAQQQLWICQPFQLKLQLHTLLQLWRQKKWSSEELLASTSAFISTPLHSSFGDRRAAEAILFASVAFCDMLRASRLFRQQRILLTEFVQDHDAVVTAIAELRTFSEHSMTRRSDHLAVVQQLVDCFADFNLLLQPSVAGQLIPWIAKYVLRDSKNHKSPTTRVQRRKKCTTNLAEDDEPLTGQELLRFVTAATPLIFDQRERTSSQGQLVDLLLASIKQSANTTMEEAAKIMRAVSSRRLAGFPTVVFKLMISCSSASERTALGVGSAKSKKSSKTKKKIIKSPRITQPLCLSAGATGDIAIALENWSSCEATTSVSSSDQLALADLHAALTSVLRKCAASKKFAAQLVSDLSTLELCAFAGAVGRNSRFAERATDLPRRALDELLRASLLKLESLHEAVKLWNTVTALQAQALPHLENDAQIAISRLLARADVLEHGCRNSPELRLWVNQWCLSVRPNQLADPIRQVTRSLHWWRS